MSALISQPGPNGQVFGKTLFHRCGFNVSAVTCSHRLIFSGEWWACVTLSWLLERHRDTHCPRPSSRGWVLVAHVPACPHPSSHGWPWGPEQQVGRSHLSFLPCPPTDSVLTPKSPQGPGYQHQVGEDPACIHLTIIFLICSNARITNQATKVTKNTALFVFKHDIHGGFTVYMLQHALFLASCLLKLGPLFSTVYQDQYV